MKKKKLKEIYFTTILKATILFILVMSVLTLFILVSNFRTTSINNTLSQLSYITDQLSWYLDAAQNFTKTLSADPVIQKYAEVYNRNPGEFTYADANSIRSQISSTIQLTNYLHSVNIYSVDGQLLASSTNYTLSDLTLDLDHRQAGIWTVQTKRSTATKQQEQVLDLIQPFYGVPTGEQVGYIEISIAEKAMTNIFTNKYEVNNHIFLTDSDDKVQITSHPEELRTTFAAPDPFLYANRIAMSSKGVVFAKALPGTDFCLVSITSYHAFFRPLITMLLITVFTTILCILSSLKISQAMALSITTPIYKLMEHIQKIKRGDWSPIPEKDLYCSDIEQLYGEFNQMIVAQDHLKNKLVSEQKMKNKLSLDLLQEQINPHFLYNTLDNICSLAEIGEQEALIQLVMSLSSFYRYGLSSGKTHISIEDELTICRSYLEIMSIRYYNKFEYHIICPEELLQYSCIKLLLQPILENSIYHGIKELNEHGVIRIEFHDQGDTIRIVVQDNGLGLKKDFQSTIDQGSSHFGIKNTNKRIQLYYGPEYGLTLQNAEPHGCIATIVIKKEIYHGLSSSDR